MTHPPVRRTLPALAFLLLALPVRAAVTYDASFGTLPESQGFTFVNAAPGAPMPVVSGGVLLQDSTSDVQQQWWERNDFHFDFGDGFGMEIEAEVLQSDRTLVPENGSYRYGLNLEAIDFAGRRISIGIAGSGVAVNTDAALMPDNGVPFQPFPATSGRHRHGVVVRADTVELWLDGVRSGTCEVGVPLFPTLANRVYFGDGGGAAGHWSRIRRVRYGDPTAVLDAPSAPRSALALVSAPESPGAPAFAVHGRPGERVRILVLDVRGALVRDLGEIAAGSQVAWDGLGGAGARASAGVYFALATTDRERAVCRATLLR